MVGMCVLIQGLAGDFGIATRLTSITLKPNILFYNEIFLPTLSLSPPEKNPFSIINTTLDQAIPSYIWVYISYLTSHSSIVAMSEFHFGMY